MKINKSKISISLPVSLLEKIDKKRGLINRSTYIVHKLKEKIE